MLSTESAPDHFLLEREAELRAIDALLAGRPATGQLLAIEGPPGIGKTSLIAEAKARAQAAGMEVLSARGSELECAFAYGVARQLFEQFLARLPAEERADLLGGSAALAKPVFEPALLAAEGAADVSLALLHGLYWLAANLAARRPLLLAVDDLHWCDLPSLRWLAYLLPRMEGLEVMVVVGLRPGEWGEDPGALAQIVADPFATVVRPAPLSATVVARLVGEALSRDADEAFISASHEETGGNPQLLRELMHAVAAERLAPTEANVARLRELGARAGSRAVLHRLSRLPPEATRLAHAVAVLGEDADPRDAAALADLDEEAAFAAADDLARADVLLPQPPFGFVHPLIRSAVYSLLSTVEQEEQHARAARLLLDSGAESERVAAHLLRAAPAAVDGAVHILGRAARGALARGAAESAVVYLRRALEEPPRENERVDVLFQLGAAETLVSAPAAVEHLREAHQLIEEPARRAEAALLLGRQHYLLHRPDESDAVFRRGLDELGSSERELSRRLEAALILNAMFEPHLYQLAVERLDQIRRRPSDSTTGEKMLLAVLAFHDARANVPADVAVALARRALAGGLLLEAGKGGGPLPHEAAVVLAMADLDEALERWDEALADAHRAGSIFAFAVAKMFRSQTLLYRGDLAEAEREGHEALEACETCGLTLAGGWLNAYLADALMEQGKLAGAAEIFARGPFEDDRDTAHAHWFLDSRARFRLASGDLRGGLEETLAVGRSFEAVGGRNPGFLPWRSQAAVALLLLGRQDEARPLAEDELALARRWGRPRALGAALRVAGLVEGGREGIALLDEAVEVLAGSPAKLEHAKARTELGAALRRANRRAEAREHLRRAIELATICGATPLRQLAETELLATGARPRRIPVSGPDSLTPSERRVAEMAAEGLTNREVAQALFVSPKTVEVHLSSVYRKLAISSRARLPAALAEPARRP